MNSGPIWHISSNRWNSAITEYALSAIRSLGLLKFKQIFSPTLGSPAHLRAEHLDVELRPLKESSPYSFRGLKLIHEAIRPRTIFTYGGPEEFLLRLIPLYPETKVYRLLAQDGWDRNHLKLHLKKYMAPAFVRGYIAPSRSQAQKLGEHYKAPVFPITLGLDSEKFFFNPKKARVNDEVLFLGRLDPVKGHLNLIRLWAMLYDKYSKELGDIKLAMVGEEKNLKATEVHELAAELRLKEGRHYTLETLRLSDTASRMNQSLMGIIPSLGSELIGRVFEEYLLCGLPVLYAPVGSLNDLGLSFQCQSFHPWEQNESQVLKLLAAIKQAQSESFEDRLQRAEKAKALLSFEAMAKSLEPLI